MENSNFLWLNVRDWTKGLVVAVIVVVIGAVQQALQTHGLDLAAFDWSGILDIAWKAALAYLGKNLLTTQNGRVLGKI